MRLHRRRNGSQRKMETLKIDYRTVNLDDSDMILWFKASDNMWYGVEFEYSEDATAVRRELRKVS